MTPDLMQFVDILAVPVLGGIIIWIWKLDARVFDIKAGQLGRDEFHTQMSEIRSELAEIRRVLLLKANRQEELK